MLIRKLAGYCERAESRFWLHQELVNQFEYKESDGKRKK